MKQEDCSTTVTQITAVAALDAGRTIPQYILLTTEEKG